MIVTIHYNEGLDLDSEQVTGVYAIAKYSDDAIAIYSKTLDECTHTYVIYKEDISYIEIF